MITDNPAQAVMTYADAMKFLDANADTPDEWIPTLASTKAADSPNAEEKIQSAVRIIAEHRKSEILLSQLAASAPAHRMDIKRAQTLLGIDDSDTFDAQHLITQFEMNAKDQPSRAADLREALEVVATTTQNQQLVNYVQTLQSQNQQQALDRPADEPRGLNNIGNTCYLASLLQYLYTIEPIRELVRRIDQHGQVLQHGIALDKKVDDATVSKAQVKRALDCK
jgi:ubiquitin carboxyl-terminal hydrolase 25/28